MTRAIKPDASHFSELKDRSSLARILIRIRSNDRRSRELSARMERHADRLLHLYVGREMMRGMVRTVVGYSPAGDLRDHHELARILARLRSGGTRHPPEIIKQMVQHASALLKLFADDATMGVVVRSLEDEAAEQDRKKRRRERALERAVGES